MPASFTPQELDDDPTTSLPDEAEAIDALEAWLATATVDEISAYYRAWREQRLWPTEEA